ncbi:hypothetical protein GQ457_04G033470 [Hibiscus cannabinus]
MALQNKTEKAAFGGADDADIHDVKFANGGCCFCMPCHGSIRWRRMAMNDTNSTSSSDKEMWWMRRWRRLREWSGAVAGTKWKTLLRRFKKNRARNGGGQPQFRYDPLSYALNFDEWPERIGDLAVADDYFKQNFSYRYAWPSLPASTKTSLDFDKEEPLLF